VLGANYAVCKRVGMTRGEAVELRSSRGRIQKIGSYFPPRIVLHFRGLLFLAFQQYPDRVFPEMGANSAPLRADRLGDKAVPRKTGRSALVFHPSTQAKIQATTMMLPTGTKPATRNWKFSCAPSSPFPEEPAGAKEL